tara:strand:- start:45112 stop:45360 length:249 start_codon:yes stop_codon:yes gene_type:complete
MDAFMKFMTVLIVVVLAYAGWQVVTGSNVFANAVVFAVGCPILGIMIWAWLDDPKRKYQKEMLKLAKFYEAKAKAIEAKEKS